MKDRWILHSSFFVASSRGVSGGTTHLPRGIRARLLFVALVALVAVVLIVSLVSFVSFVSLVSHVGGRFAYGSKWLHWKR